MARPATGPWHESHAAFRRLRILHVIKGLAYGGAERLVVSITEAAKTTPLEYEVAYLLEHRNDLVPDLEALGAHCHLLSTTGRLLDPRWLVKLITLANSFDIVHFHSPSMASMARPTLKAIYPHIKLATTEHGLWSSYHRITRIANRVTTPLDSKRWAVSSEVRQSMGRCKGSTTVLTYGIPYAKLQGRRTERSAARQRMGWTPRDFVVATVANTRPEKDYPTLLAAAQIATQQDPTVRFVAIGGGPMDVQIRQAIATTGLEDIFTMLGPQHDPISIIAGADSFALASWYEGLPISLLEAMAVGLVPVVTAVGGIPEVLTHNVNGLLVSPRDPGALAKAYLALARYPADRMRLSAAAQERAAAFDIALTEFRLRRAYAEMTKS